MSGGDAEMAVVSAAPQRGGGGGGRGITGKPKNKQAAAVQITAEQLLIEARDRMEPEPQAKPRSKLHDKEELIEYRAQKREEFEKLCQRNRHLTTNWVKYAKWEETQGEFTRARSIFERALDALPNNQSIYQRYAEFEMRTENINHARNVWQRAVTQLPRVDGLWMKWVLLEETIGDAHMCREVFKKWMEWKPKPHGWHLYCKFEVRFNEIDNAREVVKQMVTFYNDVDAWLYYARFEEKYGKQSFARKVYEESLDALDDEHHDVAKVFTAFAKFEERQREFERARAIYKIALDRIPKHQAEELYDTYTNFEKQFGERQGIEDALLARKRFEYEESLKNAPENYDTWINYARMEEPHADPKVPIEVYERAVAHVPRTPEKLYWSRYIYLWLMYAQFQELDMEDPARAREVYEQCLKIIPHGTFSFSKVWIALAEFEIRQGRLDAARQIMGKGLGVNPRPKMYRWYVDLEITLGNVDRIRNIYNAWLKRQPHDGGVWVRFADFEAKLQQTERARAIYGIAVQQDGLEQQEAVWKRYIAFEVKQRNFDNARNLFKQLSDKTRHVKVYLSWAEMELNQAKSVAGAREVYEEAEQVLGADDEAQAEWTHLLEQWKAFEDMHGTPAQVNHVDVKLHPEKARKRASKLLDKAQAWKRRKLALEQEAAAADAGGADAAEPQ